MRALAEADVVIADRLAATGLLDRLPPDVEIIDVGKLRDNHPVPQDQINDLLVDRVRARKSVVRLKGGGSFVFGRGAEEVHACLEAGISVEMVPGGSSARKARSRSRPSCWRQESSRSGWARPAPTM